MDNLPNFKERLEELMEEHSLNNSSLEKAGVAPNTTVSAWRTKSVYPKVCNLIKLSDYFDCSIDYLLGVTDFPQRYRNMVRSSFAKRIASLVAERGISYYRVYTDCGIPSSYFTRWLKCGLIPEVPTLIKLANYFNCSVEYLLGLSDVL